MAAANGIAPKTQSVWLERPTYTGRPIFLKLMHNVIPQSRNCFKVQFEASG